MIRIVLATTAVLLLLGCGGAAVPTVVPVQATAVSDPATGLPLNPATTPDGEFIVEGRVTAINIIPQDEPLFKVEADNGNVYQLIAQPLPDIVMADGSAVESLDFRNGIRVRATVFQGEAEGLGGEPILSSHDLTVLSLVGE